MLTAIAELIEAQETPLSAKQNNFLDSISFGGMGSLNDLSFEQSSLGPDVEIINLQLMERRGDLFAAFNG